MKGFFKKIIFLFFIVFFLYPSYVYSMHPLITDDTGTQGKGNWQMEINGKYDYDEENNIKTQTVEGNLTLSYGLAEPLDIVFSLPLQYNRIEEVTEVTREKGMSDTTIELKWRIWGKDGLSFAVKPGVILPTGDDERGLGSGRTSYSLFFISSYERQAFSLHFNLGYIRNENKFDEEENLWHVSFAPVYNLTDKIKICANVGMEKNPLRDENTNPAFILGGLVYSLTDNFDVDFGLKHALNAPEVDYSLLFGLTWRF